MLWVRGPRRPHHPLASVPFTPATSEIMATELNPGGWDGGEPVAEPEVVDGWAGDEPEAELPLPMEETGVSEVKLFNKW